jgi:hypothetical protein
MPGVTEKSYSCRVWTFLGILAVAEVEKLKKQARAKSGIKNLNLSLMAK